MSSVLYVNDSGEIAKNSSIDPSAKTGESWEPCRLAKILAAIENRAYTGEPHLPLPQKVRQVETRQVICEGRLPLIILIRIYSRGEDYRFRFTLHTTNAPPNKINPETMRARVP